MTTTIPPAHVPLDVHASHPQVVIAGHAFVQNLRRGRYELVVDVRPPLRVAAAFTELARAI